MKRRSFVELMVAAAAAASLPVGCARPASQDASQTKTHLTVYLWQSPLLEKLVPYIQRQLPDADIEFLVGNNGVDLYCYLQEHGQLPDIITTRRFAANDAKNLQPYLADFTSYDITSAYSPSALQYFRNVDGSIQWLPICGIPETTIANKSLIERCGCSLPGNYDDFAQLCRTLDAQGVKPYVCELAEDWACHSLLQGAAIDQFESIDGIEWRSQAESTQGGIEFDEELWTRVFEEVQAFIDDACLVPSDVDCELPQARQAFLTGQAAMFRGTPEVMDYLKANMADELVRLPYFSQTSDEGWAYTYASMNVALNKALESDRSKLDAALAVLDCLISEEGQAIIAGGTGMISYNANVPSSLDGMEGIQPEVAENQFYIRYSSANSFPASLRAVAGLAGSTMTCAEALAAFEEEMNAPVQDDVAVQFDATYSLAANENGGRDAASSILTTVRESLGAELAFTPYSSYTSSIYEGSCAETQLKMLVAQNNDTSLYTFKLSGAQIKRVVEEYLAGNGTSFAVSNAYMLPIASGMKLSIRQSNDGFSLDGIAVQGQPIDEARTYSIVLCSETAHVLCAIDSTIELKSLDKVSLSNTWVQAIGSGQQPAAPEDYIALARGKA